MLDAPRTLVTAKAGARGLVKYAWHTAAELTGFVITVDPATRVLTLGGTVVESNPYWLAAAPLTFIVPTKTGALRWPIEAWTVTDGRVVARLGALEKD